MTRRWPVPPLGNTLQVLGDVQGVATGRKSIVTEDCSRSTVPDVAYRVQVGDLIGGTGNPALFPAAINFVDSLGTGQWWAVVGNHDYDNTDMSPSPAEAAASMGMPGTDFTVDLGYAVLICTYVRAGTGVDPDPYDPTWLSEQLDLYPNRTCLIAAHAPLFADPVPASGISPEGDEILTMLANYPQAKAWLCGHTHRPIDDPGIVEVLDVGSHQMAQVDGSAIYYTTPGVNWTDRLVTTWLTVEADRLEVRFRDHGAHQWIGGGVDGTKVWTFNL